MGIAFTGISRSHGQQIDEALHRLLENRSEPTDDLADTPGEETLTWQPVAVSLGVS